MSRIAASIVAVSLKLVLPPAGATDVDVTSVETPGSGRYERNTNYFLFVAGKSHDAAIPVNVSEGDRILVRYRVDGEVKSEEFVVRRISSREQLCRLHDAVPSQHNRAPGNIIYIKPCKVTAK